MRWGLGLYAESPQFIRVPAEPSDQQHAVVDWGNEHIDSGDDDRKMPVVLEAFNQTA